MEHRHYPREQVDLSVELISGDGKTYLVRILELSANGMRVVTNEKLPEHIKSLTLRLPVFFVPSNIRDQLRMFIVHRNGLELGLCLVNDDMRFDIERLPSDTPATSLRRYATY